MEIAAYVGGESKIPGVERVIKLSSNEGPFGPSPMSSKAHALEAETLHRYPDGGAVETTYSDWCTLWFGPGTHRLRRGL